MKINLWDIEDKPGPQRWEEDPGEFFKGIEKDWPVFEKWENHLETTLQVTLSGRTLLVELRSACTLWIRCGRCGTPFEYRVQAEEDIPLERTEDGFAIMNMDSASLEGLKIIEGYLLDPGDMIRQKIEVELPQYPLCDKACKGLCSKCGANLNGGDCQCGASRSKGDPRLKGLKRFME